MMSSKPLSIMDHMSKAEDMQYLIQPRGPGTGWTFRMITPPHLVGTPNPWTGRPFRKEVRKGLATRRITEARRLRDIALGEIRALALMAPTEARYALDDALAWRDAIAKDKSKEGAVASVLSDRLEAASRVGVPDDKLKRFGRVAFGKGFLLTTAVEQFLDDRGPDGKRGYKVLKPTTVDNLKTALRHLRDFLGDTEGMATLESVTARHARQFRDEYLPSVKSNRSSGGLSHKTVAKNVTLLKQLWVWAIVRNKTADRYKNPWVFASSIPMAKASGVAARADYSPDEINKLFAAAPIGGREGDLLRLAVVTGCRVDELASLLKAQVDHGGAGLRLPDGKTTNSRRFVPIPEAAQGLLVARLAISPSSPRLFPEWPVRPSVGKVYAASQWFTRFRREVLGKQTDGRLSLHSTRHTWRTVARRAGVSPADCNDLGGWAGPRTSSSVYDHGPLEDQLRASQEKVWAELEQTGYLTDF